MASQRLSANGGACFCGSLQQPKDGGSKNLPVVLIPSSARRYWILKKKIIVVSNWKKLSVEVRANKSGIFGGRSDVEVSNKLGSADEDALVRGTKRLLKFEGTQKLPSKGPSRIKDNNAVFVAGATGKVGRRVVRELLKLGFRVRAGVRSVDRAQSLLEIAAEIEPEKPVRANPWSNFSPEKIFGFVNRSKEEAPVELIECDLESPDDIEDALGNVGLVVCTIGASEKEVLDVTGPYRIDYKATKNLIDAATTAKVNHFVLVTSLGTTKFGWPASVLNLFWGVLIWKAKAEKALVESGIPFTIVRPGGMEKPTDAYKETHNLRLLKADSVYGGQVSNLQVAELIASIASNLDLARNKVLEAVAETTTPLRPIEDLLAEIPSLPITKLDEDFIKEDAKAAKQRDPQKKLATKEEIRATEERKEEERLAREERLAAEKEKTEALRKALQSQYEEARRNELEARKDADAALAEKEEIEKQVAELRSKAKAAAQAAREAKALGTAIIIASRQGKKLSDQEKQAIISEVRAEIAAEAKQKETPKMEENVEFKEEVRSKAVKSGKLEKKMIQVAEEKAKAAAQQERLAKEREVAEVEAEGKRKAEAAKAVADAERTEADKLAKAEAEAEAGGKEKEREINEAERNAKKEDKEIIKAKYEREAAEEKGAEERLKIEAATKALREAAEEKETTAVSSKKQEVRKPFRWFWQKEEQEKEVGIVTDNTTSDPVNQETTERPQPTKPQSPYTQYPGLRPPSSPTPKAPKFEEDVTKGATEVVKSASLESAEAKGVTSDKQNGRTLKAATFDVDEKVSKDIPRPEPQKLSLRWPWLKDDSAEEGSPAEVNEEAADASTIVNESTKEETYIQAASVQKNTKLPIPSRPLSPFTRFLNLKPPTFPSPPSLSTSKPTESAVGTEAQVPRVTDGALQQEGKLSSESQYPDPKLVTPATWPEVDTKDLEKIQAREEEERLKKLAFEEEEEVATREKLAVEKALAASKIRWPWEKPEVPLQEKFEVVPEVSGMLPSDEVTFEPVSAVSTKLVASSDAVLSAPTEFQEPTSAPGLNSTELTRTLRPLSPYWRYPGLKPPSPPTDPAPSSPVNKLTAETVSELSIPSEGQGGDRATEDPTIDGEKAKVLDPASSNVRWPWVQ